MKSFLCIGDIHGCIQQLRELMDAIHHALAAADSKSIPERIQWIFLGDYIDRGPDPAGVIEYLRRHAKRYPESVFLRGNHEEMLFDVIESVGPERAAAFLNTKGITNKNYEWLWSNTRYVYESGGYIFAHAGLNAERSLADQNNDDFLWSYHESEYGNAPTRQIVHGHITIENVAIVGNNINVDTGCGKGGRLSAILLPEERIFQSATPGLNQRRLDLLREIQTSPEEVLE
jgi:serine/threonine protein phosphatase 1